MDIMESGYKMLGSTGTQYLNPDYIQPLPTTLDSKNSPLALLAQTCSSIGKDSGSSRISVPSLSDKKDSSSHQRDSCNAKDGSYKQRPSDSPVGCFAAGSSRSGDSGRTNKSGEKSSKDCSSRSSCSSGGGGGVGGVGGSGIGGGGRECSPKSRAHSSRPLSSLMTLGNGSGKCTPSSGSTFAANSGSLLRDYSSTRGSTTTTSAASGISLSSSTANNNNKTIGDVNLIYDGYTDDILKSNGLASSTLLQQHSLQEALRLQHESLQSLQAVGLGPLPSGYPPLLFSHPLAAAALDPLMYSYSASLAAVHGLALTSHKLPTLSPYMGYARVSAASGGSTLVPVCKDPYCTTGSVPPSLHPAHNIPPSAAGTAAAPCAAGCTQCGSGVGQDKCHQCATAPPVSSLANGSLGGLGQYSSSLYPLSLTPGGLANPLLGMAAAHLGVGLTPYACSWLSGGEFCGKRFSKAEDLLQHLRTHASSGEPAVPAFPLSGVPLPGPGFVGAAGAAGHPFSIAGSLSPSSLLQQASQGYPRSLSPNSLLTASRYHPYKSPFAAVLPSSTGGSGSLAGTASALDAYYSSPYALFGHRIGAATVGP